MPSQLLTKSQYLAGLQCRKYLWIQVYEPEQVPQTDTVTQYVFDQGHLVGEYAKRLYPGGIDIPQDDFTENIVTTKKLFAERRPLFEAGILAGRIYCRVDILNPVNENEWDIIEIKSGTSIKDVHIDDVSFQKYCCEKAGLKIKTCKLGFINNQYVKNGEIDPQELFVLEDISARVEEVSESIEERVADLLEVLSNKVCPDTAIGRHCLAPYECPLQVECWGFLPENSIFDLRGGKTKQFSLYEQGILSIKDIPGHIPLSRQQKIQKECVSTGKVHVEKDEIRQFLKKLKYPLYYLDFETFGQAIPIYDGTRPYQDIPFQFSLHVVESEESQPLHHSFLAQGTEDPRPQILHELKSLLGFEGSIIAYCSGFEEGVLKGLVEAFPQYTAWLKGILTRMVDLLSPFANFHYYNASQKDTVSLKKVLPAVSGRGYEEMTIGAGMDASVAFARIACGNATEEEIAKVRADLLNYCRLDTEGMIWVADELRRLSN
ncbi:MAG: DUF2779 domain-containing protein [Dehalococcoidia bacterium]|nr:DUF2779 domain-containing protein [Dehalococcoidia bacterium]